MTQTPTTCRCERCEKRRAEGIPNPLCSCQWCQDRARAQYLAWKPEYEREPHPEARPKRWTGQMKKDDLEARLALIAEIERVFPDLEPHQRPELQVVLDHPETYSRIEMERLLQLTQSAARTHKERQATTAEEQEQQALRDREELGYGGKIQ